MELDESNSSIRRASHVVGIGASAGGLEAMLDLLRALPPTLGMAYVFVQHLDPHAGSALADLLSKVTAMPVCQAQEGTVVQENQVYVVPPPWMLTISQGVLHLHPRVPTRGEVHTIDTFLSSLAEDTSLFPLGIILSGAGSDGTRGLQTIKAQGGITLAQDVTSATYPDMPRSALASGCVDVVAPVEELANMLTLYSGRLPLTRSLDIEVSGLLAHEEAQFQAILQLVLDRTGIDFSAYKSATIRRRLFHYALNPDGVLLLVPSETIGSAASLFTPVDARWKLYSKKTGTTSRFTFENALSGYERSASTAMREVSTRLNEVRHKSADLGSLVDQVLLTRHVPASVVVDEGLHIVYVRGPTDRYLTPASGKTSLHLLKMVHSDLLLGLRAAIALAQQEGRAVTKELIRLDGETDMRRVAVEVIPLRFPSTERFLLLLFREAFVAPLEEGPDSPTASPLGFQRSREEWIRTLERERTTLQDEATLLVEELEETNQELQQVNEDIRSHNEELQSTNEELETAKEELQVINDELNRANLALESRNEQLQIARQYAEAVVETVREPLIVLDADLRVIQANQSFYRLFQTVPESTEGSLLAALGDGQWNIPELLTLLQNILPANHTFEGFEIDNTFPAIGHRTFLLNARQVNWEDTHPQRILLTFEDITERKVLDQQKDDFIRIASHELNTPMTSVKGYAELLWSQFQRAGDERAAEQMANMNEQIDHFLSLLGEVLDVTMLETGQMPLHRKRFDLQALLRKCVEEVQRITQTQHIMLEEQEVCWVDADPHRIGQVVTNLLTNAIKYAPASPLIGVKLTRTPTGVTCSVQDRGPGIALEKQTCLFKRFSRITNDESRGTSQGLGLGLYLTAQIIERHGGRIWVESEEGQGATFSFTLLLSPVHPGSEEGVESL